MDTPSTLRNNESIAPTTKKTDDESKKGDESFMNLVSAQQELLSKMEFMTDADFDPYEEVEVDDDGNCIGVMVYGPTPSATEPVMHQHQRSEEQNPMTMLGSDHPSLAFGDDDYILDDMSLHSSDLEMDRFDAFPDDDDDGWVGEGHHSCPNFYATKRGSAFDSCHPKFTSQGDYHWPTRRQGHFGHSSWGPSQMNNPQTAWNMRDRNPTDDSFNSTCSSNFRPVRRERSNTDDSITLHCKARKQPFHSSFSSLQTQETIACSSSFERDGSGWSNGTRLSAGGPKDICKSVQFLSIARKEEV